MAEIKQLPRSGNDTPRAESARAIIFASAIALFGKKGFRATSMNEIAQACGVSKPAIYHYFDSKSHLLEMLYEDATRDFFANMEKLSKAPIPPAARLREFIAAHALYNIGNSQFLKIFWRERHELDDRSRRSLAARERAYEASVLRIIEDGEQDGSFPPGQARIKTLAILGLLSTVQRWAPYAGAPPEAVASAVMGLVMGGMLRAVPGAVIEPDEATAPFESAASPRKRRIGARR